jgi:hypothetical protein
LKYKEQRLGPLSRKKQGRTKGMQKSKDRIKNKEIRRKKKKTKESELLFSDYFPGKNENKSGNMLSLFQIKMKRN